MDASLIRHFRRQFDYDEWANREALAAVRASRASLPRGLQLCAHILSAESLWLERLQQRPQSHPVWPEWRAEECDARIAELGQLWPRYLDALAPEDLSKTIAYKNSKGEPWSSTVEDIITHVLMHSAYHRGQIASMMRSNGDTPAYTDFIHAVRQEKLGKA